MIKEFHLEMFDKKIGGVSWYSGVIVEFLSESEIFEAYTKVLNYPLLYRAYTEAMTNDNIEQ